MWCTTDLLLGVVVFLASYVALKKLSDPLRPIPGPAGLPFIGHLLQIEFSTLHLKLHEWSRAYGPVMKFRLMGQDIIVLSNIVAVREALVTRGADFAGRPPAYRVQRVFFGKDIVFQNFSSTMVALKRMALNALKPYGEGMRRLEAIMAEAVAEFTETVGRKEGRPFDIEKETGSFVCNVMTTLLYGQKLALDDPTLNKVRDMNQSVQSIADPTATGKELDMLPWLRHTFISTRGLAMVEKAERLRREIVEAKLKEAKDTLDPSNLRGCLDYFLLAQQAERDEQGHPVWDDEHLTALCLNFIVAGMNTTSSAMSAVYLLLLKYPDIQARLQKEIDDVVGRVQAPTLEHSDAMPYVQAFVVESLRYMTLVPILIPKMTTASSRVGGYYIPANTRVFINAWSVHHDAAIYPEPFKFNPDRFLDEAGRLLPHDHPARTSFIAFGLGRRICIGENLARSRMFLLITALLQRFTLVEDAEHPAPDHDPRTFRMQILLDPPNCPVRAVARY